MLAVFFNYPFTVNADGFLKKTNYLFQVLQSAPSCKIPCAFGHAWGYVQGRLAFVLLKLHIHCLRTSRRMK